MYLCTYLCLCLYTAVRTCCIPSLDDGLMGFSSMRARARVNCPPLVCTINGKSLLTHTHTHTFGQSTGKGCLPCDESNGYRTHMKLRQTETIQVAHQVSHASKRKPSVIRSTHPHASRSDKHRDSPTGPRTDTCAPMSTPPRKDRPASAVYRSKRLAEMTGPSTTRTS